MRKTDHQKEKHDYKKRFELSLIITLFFFIILFNISKRFPFKNNKTKSLRINTIIDIVDIPITKQGLRLKTHSVAPTIPIPVEDEFFPEDEIINDPIYLDFNNSQDHANMGLEGKDNGFGIVIPRPLIEVIPEFPESLRKKGINGVVELSLLVNHSGRVDSVLVIKNTTNNQTLELLAIQAAFKTQFHKINNKSNYHIWVNRSIRFSSN